MSVCECVCVFIERCSRIVLTILHWWFVSKCRSDHKPILYFSGRLKKLALSTHITLYELWDVCVCVLNKLTCCSRPDLTVVNSLYSVFTSARLQVPTTNGVKFVSSISYREKKKITRLDPYLSLYLYGAAKCFFFLHVLPETHTHTQTYASFGCHTGNFVQKEFSNYLNRLLTRIKSYRIEL